MKIELLDIMGDDLMVVNAARVSFDKQSRALSLSDEKLIMYLAKHNHWTPFAHPQIQMRVTAPIFIANQLKRHQIGLALNEVSRRYVSDTPEFFTPNEWRTKPEGNIKQGSGNGKVTSIFEGETIEETYNQMLAVAVERYEACISAGMAPELARMMLPQSMMTSWIWTGSLMAFIRIYKQRIDSHAQREAQMIAQQIGDILDLHFTVSFEAWCKK